MAKNAKTGTVLANAAILAGADGAADPATENTGGAAADGGSAAADAGQTAQAQAVVDDTAQSLTNTGADASLSDGTSLSSEFGSQDNGQEVAVVQSSAAVEPVTETNSTDPTTAIRDTIIKISANRILGFEKQRLPPAGMLNRDGSTRSFSSDEQLIEVVMTKSVKIDGVLLEHRGRYFVAGDTYDELEALDAIED